MKFEFPIELSEQEDPIAWHPTIPAATLKAYKGKSVNVTREYLEKAASETRRYYEDQRRHLGNVVHRPVLFEAHEDADLALKEGRRSGDLIDFAVREFKGRPTLFVKTKWRKDSWAAIKDRKLEHGSIRIKPSYTDEQTGEVYSPFIDEFSETTKPVVKDFRLTDTIDPKVLASVGLTLAEDAPSPEPEEMTMQDLSTQMQELVQSVTEITSAVGALATKLETITQRLEALEGGGEEEPEEGAETPAEGEDVAASETDTNVIELSEMRDEMASMKEMLKKAVRVADLNTSEKGTPGDIAASEEDPDKAKRRILAEVKREGFAGMEAVEETKRRMEAV